MSGRGEAKPSLTRFHVYEGGRCRHRLRSSPKARLGSVLLPACKSCRRSSLCAQVEGSPCPTSCTPGPWLSHSKFLSVACHVSANKRCVLWGNPAEQLH